MIIVFVKQDLKHASNRACYNVNGLQLCVRLVIIDINNNKTVRVALYMRPQGLVQNAVL